MTNEALGEQLNGLVKLIEAQNKSVELQFKGVNDRLDKINGRIGKNEDKVNDIILQNATNVGIYKEDQAGHYGKCPNTKKIQEVAEKVEEYEKKRLVEYQDLNFFLRHPKVFVGILVVLVVLTIGSLYQGHLTMTELERKANVVESTQ